MTIDCSSVPDTLSVNITNIDDAGTVEVEELSELRLACTDPLAQVGIIIINVRQLQEAALQQSYTACVTKAS